MKRFLILLTAVLIAGSAFGAVKLNTGMTYNMFSDTRITGLNQTLGVCFSIGDMDAEWVFENAVLNANDETTGASIGAVGLTINSIRFVKTLTGDIGAGIELGSLATAGALTTNSGAPLMGIFGQYAMETETKDVTTSILVRLGMRTADIADSVLGASPLAVTSLDSLGISLLISVGF